MNILLAVALFAGLFPQSGCRSARDNQIDILERELRAQEDYIYELEDYIVDYSEKLRQYRCAQMDGVVVSKSSSEPELAPPRRTTIEKEAASTSESLRDQPTEEALPDTTKPADSEKTPELSPEDLEAPELEIGETVSMGEAYENATPLAEADLEGTLLADGSFIPDPSAYQTAVISEAVAEVEVDETANEDGLVEGDVEPFEEEVTPTRSREPERLVISHVFGNTSETEEPTSLLSIVEARDASNEPADFNGRVSLMVMTIVEEKLQKVKRWDFTAEETSAAWQSSNLGDGLHLELPLEEIELPNGPLELWVRLETADGRKLLSQIPFERTTLASIEEADEHVAAVEDEIDGATHLSEANPLRRPKPVIKTEPLKDTVAEQSKSEPQWRAATHYSGGSNTGYATTATAQKWTSRASDGKSPAQTAVQPQPQNTQRQWRARK